MLGHTPIGSAKLHHLPQLPLPFPSSHHYRWNQPENRGTCHCDHIRLWICSGEFRDSSKEQQQFKVQRSEHLNSVCVLGGGSWCRVGVGEAWMLVSGRHKSESWLFY